MTDITSSHISVIGLGGCGGLIVNSIKDTALPNVNCFHLDFDSEIFGDFFYGYQTDVYPKIHSWVERTSPDLLTWLNVSKHYSPLRELPDIFMRGATRSIMRASLLLHRSTIDKYFKSVLNSPTKVIVASSTSGSTGSAWVMDIATMIKQILPSTPIEISFVYNHALQYFSNSKILNYKTYWTLREALICSELNFELSLHSTYEDAVVSISETINKRSQSGSKPNIEKALLEATREVAAKFSPFEQLFWIQRARAVSDLLTEEIKNLIAGYVLTAVEGRCEFTNNNQTLEFNCRQTNRNYKINFLFVQHTQFGGLKITSGYGLALSPYENWDPLQFEAYKTICSEGALARFGQNLNLRKENLDKLGQLSEFLKSKIDELSRYTQSLDTDTFRDILPHYIQIVKQILSNNS